VPPEAALAVGAPDAGIVHEPSDEEVEAAAAEAAEAAEGAEGQAGDEGAAEGQAPGGDEE
jgi:hypothetical protein